MAETPENLYSLIKSFCLRIGAQVNAASGAAATASTPVYIDSNSAVQTGGFPFVVPMIAGVASTSAAVLSMTGSATGSANELMHQTLVLGSNATAVIGGYYRITVTDNAGVVTNGDYYAPFYTLG